MLYSSQIFTAYILHNKLNHLYRRQHNIAQLDEKTFHQSGGKEILLPQDFPDTVYLTLDVDGLDPSVIRATGTPVPGCLGRQDSLAIIEKVTQNRTVIGFDVFELALQESDHASSFAAALLVYSIMGIIQQNQA